MQNDAKLLAVRDVMKEYPAPGGPLRVLSGVSFELDEGDSIVIMGPSGSGKSTLLNIVGTLDSPTSGRVLFRGSDVHELGPDDSAKFRNERIGFVFQDHHLLPQCTVIENVLLPCLAFGRVTSDKMRRADELLEKVGLTERRHHFPWELSGGERQRAALARALINRPDLLLCDEPTGNLDARNSEDVAKLLLAVQRETGVGLIVVTHNAGFADFFGKCRNLREGRLDE